MKFITKNGKKIPIGNKPRDTTDYSKKVDAYFKSNDGKIEKKSMSIKEYKKASKKYPSSAWGVNARELEHDFNKHVIRDHDTKKLKELKVELVQAKKDLEKTPDSKISKNHLKVVQIQIANRSQKS